MSATRVVRRNEKLLPVFRAAALAAIGLSAINATAFFPRPLMLILGVGIGALGFAAPAGAALVIILATALPLLAADLAVGLAFTVIALVSLQYLGQQRAAPFIVVGSAMLATSFGAEWAVPVLAGYLLGAGDGGATAIAACVAIELAGLALGESRLGAVIANGSKSLVDFAPVSDPLAFGWLAESLKNVSPDPLLRTLKTVADPLALVVQPLLWGGAAMLAGQLRRPAENRYRMAVGIAGVAAASVSLAAGSAIAMRAIGSPLPSEALGLTGAVSLVVALGVTLLSETLFARRLVTPERTLGTTAQEDADVDELLRLIAEAEDELASKHTSDSVVMITDMKSFSRMTEEDGSIVSAKMIQRHRDLLLPVIQNHGGHGKSTGGDGLVAAFASSVEAVRAAVEMQRTLESFNAARPQDRDLLVRVGISSGEVVLDRNGRPFIGNGLNRAARVMNLADGGQIFISGEIADQAKSAAPGLQPLGRHELKNIADAVDIVEVLWQEPAQAAV